MEGTDKHARWTDKQGRLGHLTRKEEVRVTQKHKTADLKAYFFMTRKLSKKNAILFRFICFVMLKHSNKQLLI